MKTVSEILDQIIADVEIALPPLLSAEGLNNFDVYKVGQSRKENVKILSLYKAVYKKDDTEAKLILLFALQLYKTDHKESEKYSDVLFDWLDAVYDPSEIDYNLIDSLMSETIPVDNDQTTMVLITIEYSAKLDSCD